MVLSYFPWSWLKWYLIVNFHFAGNLLASVSECKPTKEIFTLTIHLDGNGFSITCVMFLHSDFFSGHKILKETIKCSPMTSVLLYPFVHKSCSGLFPFVFMSLLDLTWIICYFSWFCPRLYLSICWSIALMQLSPVPMPWQYQLNSCVLILSTSWYMRSSSLHLPNFNRNIIPWSHFSCIAVTFSSYLRFLKIFYLFSYKGRCQKNIVCHIFYVQWGTLITILHLSILHCFPCFPGKS